MAAVTVQVVTYNSARTIEQALHSVLSQTEVDLEIIVVDNASSDHTVQLVEAMGITVIRNRENRGYAAAHNQALARSNSRYVLTLNPDVWLAPEFLSALSKTLDVDDHVGSASGCLLRVDDLADQPRIVDSTGLYMKRSRRQGLRHEGEPIEQRPHDTEWIFGPDGAAAFYRRAMLEDIADHGEVFDEDFFMHKEDVDVCWRALLRGWRSRYVPEAVAHHIRTFRPGQRQQVDARLRFYGVRNRYLLLLKNERWATFWKDAPYILAYDLAIIVYLLLLERESLGAIRSVWQLRQRTLAKRKFIQARVLSAENDVAAVGRFG